MRIPLDRWLGVAVLVTGAVLWAQESPDAGPTAPPPAAESTIEVVVEGLKSDDGLVRVALYSSPDGFPTKESKGKLVSVPIKNHTAMARFEGVAPGTYAVGTCHDENGNDKCDTNFLGIPKEGLACSNNAHTMTMFIPKWKDAQFNHAGGVTKALIGKVKY